jgi:hypothetical protein
VDHYQLKELAQEDDQGRKSYATKEAYRLDKLGYAQQA